MCLDIHSRARRRHPGGATAPLEKLPYSSRTWRRRSTCGDAGRPLRTPRRRARRGASVRRKCRSYITSTKDPLNQLGFRVGQLLGHTPSHPPEHRQRRRVFRYRVRQQFDGRARAGEFCRDLRAPRGCVLRWDRDCCKRLVRRRVLKVTCHKPCNKLCNNMCNNFGVK